MDTLKIPELGLVLDGSASKEPGLPAQAFTITLDDSVVRDMVSCVKAGGKIELALGNSPVRTARWVSLLFPNSSPAKVAVLAPLPASSPP